MFMLGTLVHVAKFHSIVTFWSRNKKCRGKCSQRRRRVVGIPMRHSTDDMLASIGERYVHACQSLFMLRKSAICRGTFPFKYEDRYDEDMCMWTISECSLHHSFIFMHLHACRHSSRMRIFMRRGSHHVAAHILSHA